MKSNRTNRFLGLLRRFFSASAIVMSFLGAAQAGVNKFFNSASSGTNWNADAVWGTVSGGPYTSAWATYDFAVFEGTGATITLAVNPTCDRITFNVNGYKVVGGTLSFGNPTGINVTVATGVSATISSNLSQTYGTGIRLSGTGTLILNGTNTTNANALVADNGTISITGGATTAGSLWTGDTASNNGTMSVSAGTLTINGVSTMGTRAVGTLTVSGTGQVTTSSLVFGNSGTSGGTGTVNLNGGTLTSGSVTEAGTHTSTFNFNGGTLKPSASSATFMQGVDRANVRNGGVIIDTNGKDVTIGQALLHSNIGGDNALDAGLTKLGAGTVNLTSAATYTGPTTVNAGTLSVNEVSSTSGITVNDGAALTITGTTGATISVPTLVLGSTAAGTGTSLSLNNFVGSISQPLIHATNLTVNGVAVGSPRGVTVNVTGSVPAGVVFPAAFPLVQSDNPYGGIGFGASSSEPCRATSSGRPWMTREMASSISRSIRLPRRSGSAR